MATINHHTREINFKIVYYGTGLGGKTTTLQYLHQALDAETRGPLIMLPTSQDRTLYFDFLPLRLPELRGYSTRIHLYTVPGQVYYNATRKLVLAGADGVVFVADSQRDRKDANIESMCNLIENLGEQQLSLDVVPCVLQYNKRDLPEVLPVAELKTTLNPAGVEGFETIATTGTGVLDALKTIVRLILTEYRTSEQAKQDPLVPPGGSDEEARPAISGAASAPAQRQQRKAARGPNWLHTVPSPGEIASAIDGYGEGAGVEVEVEEPAYPAPAAWPAISLSTLVQSPRARDAIAAVERQIARGDWAGAVRQAAEACRDLSTEIGGALASKSGADAFAMSAFFVGMPARRYFRLCEAEARSHEVGALSSADAVFALFFIMDFALRSHERGAPSELD